MFLVALSFSNREEVDMVVGELVKQVANTYCFLAY
jgi:hypothetical protein